MSFIQESAMLTALLLAAAGLAVVAWRKVMVPMARLLELSEDLAGLATDPAPCEAPGYRYAENGPLVA
jgi:hypothetical protein